MRQHPIRALLRRERIRLDRDIRSIEGDVRDPHARHRALNALLGSYFGLHQTAASALAADVYLDEQPRLELVKRGAG